MKKIFYILFSLAFSVFIYSCKPKAAKKALEMVRHYSGKTVSGTKKLHLEKHADDFTQFKFTKVRCVACSGTGNVGYATCEKCNGDGWIYKVERR